MILCLYNAVFQNHDSLIYGKYKNKNNKFLQTGNKIRMSQDKNLLKTGRFYFIYDDPVKFVLEDKTKRGLPVIEIKIDDTVGVMAENGRFYDGNGRGHVIPIRWYFPKNKYNLDQVSTFGDKLDSRYKAIMEETCPDY